MPLYKRLIWRFLRGFVAGALPVFTTVQWAHFTTFGEAAAFLATLFVAASIGGMTGALLALDKYLRTHE